MRRRLLPAVLAAALLAGCGDDAPAPAPATSAAATTAAASSVAPSARAVWARQADEVCAAGRAERAGLGTPGSLLEIGLFATAAGDSLDAELAALRALTPAPGDEAAVAAMLDAAAQEVRALRRIARRAGQGDQAAVAAIATDPRYRSAEATASSAAAALGLVVCGTPERA